MTENHVIEDVKYKPMGNIGKKDYLQALAYMFRFDAKKAITYTTKAKGQKEKNCA